MVVSEGSNVNVYQEEIQEGGMTFVVSILEVCGVSGEYAGLYTCNAFGRSTSDISPVFWVNVTAAQDSGEWYWGSDGREGGR